MVSTIFRTRSALASGNSALSISPVPLNSHSVETSGYAARIAKIELSTDADDLNAREPSDDEMVNSKLLVYKLFKRYLKAIEK